MTATWQNAKNQETSKKLSIIQQKPLKKSEMRKGLAKRRYIEGWSL